MGRLAALVLLLAAMSAAPAAATPAISAPVSDGARYAAWAVDTQTTRVLDARSGELLDVPTPGGCSAVTAVGGGVVAWTCRASGSPVPYATLMEIASGRIFLPAGTAQFAAQGSDCTWGTWSEIGRWWMRTRCDGYHYGYFVEVNWRTGAERRFDYGDFPADMTPSSDRHGLISLDSASGRRTLCAPAILATRPGQRGFGGFFPAQITRMDDGWVAGTGAAGDGISVERCGQRRIEVLCRSGCGDLSFGGGWVSWTSPGRVRAARLGRHGIVRRTSRAVPTGAGVTRAGAVVLVATGLPGPGTTAPPGDVRLLRLPGAPPLPAG